MGAKAYQNAGGPRLVEGMNREQTCVRYQEKVFLIARRIHAGLSRNATVQLGDLTAWGAIGLLEAFDRFDPVHGVRFPTYAEHRIRGTIYDALRARDTTTRRRRDLGKRIAAAHQRLLRKHVREPEPEEVAAELGVDMDQYWAAIEATKPISEVSYDLPADDGRPILEILTDPSQSSAEQRILAHEVRNELKKAILELPERQRQCLMMYHDREMSLAEIAAVYEVSVSRISQILTEARAKLKRRLMTVIEVSDLGEVG